MAMAGMPWLNSFGSRNTKHKIAEARQMKDVAEAKAIESPIIYETENNLNPAEWKLSSNEAE